MARYNFIGRARDPYGNVVSGVSVYVYLTGTTSPATIFLTKVDNNPISVAPQIASDVSGYFQFYVDNTIHSYDQLFDLVVSGKTYSSIDIFRSGTPAGGLTGTKIYYVSDTSSGPTTRKLTFVNGILTSET